MDNLDQSLITPPVNNGTAFGKPIIEKGSNVKKIVLIIFVVFFSLALVSGVSAYFYVTRIAVVSIEKVMTNLEATKSVQFQVKSNFDITPKKPSQDASSSLELGMPDYSSMAGGLIPTDPASGEIIVQGAIDSTDKNNDKGWVTLSLLAQTKAESKKFEVEAKFKDKVNYVKINTMPTLGNFDLNFITNKWIKIDISSNGEKGGISELFGKVDALKAEAVQQNQVEIDKQQAEFKDFLTKNPVLIITNKFLPTRLDGAFVYHVAYKVNEENLRKILEKTYSLDVSNTSTNPDDPFVAFAEQMQANNQKRVDSLVLVFKNLTGEIWLGMADLLPRQITFNLTSENQATFDKLSGNGTLTFSNYNQPVEVTFPEQSISIDQIMQEFMGQMFGGLDTGLGNDTSTALIGTDLGQNHVNLGTSSILNDNTDISLVGADANLDSDKDGLPDAIEKSLGTDSNNVDTDGDGYSDNTEFLSGHDPLKK